MRKCLAALMCIVMLLGLAACSKPADNPSPDSTEQVLNAFGTLMLNMNAVIRIAYDENGQVLALIGDNEAGRQMASRFPEAKGTACAQTVGDLIAAIIDAAYDMGQNTVILKQTKDSKLPSDTFLEDIGTSAKAAAPNHKIFLVSADSLTDEGYLPSQTILNILVKQLDLVNPTLIEDPQILDGQYYFIIELSGSTYEYLVDADTGVLKKVFPNPEGDGDDPSSLLPGVSTDDPSDLEEETPDPEPVQDEGDPNLAPTE